MKHHFRTSYISCPYLTECETGLNLVSEQPLMIEKGIKEKRIGLGGLNSIASMADNCPHKIDGPCRIMKVFFDDMVIEK